MVKKLKSFFILLTISLATFTLYLLFHGFFDISNSQNLRRDVNAPLSIDFFRVNNQGRNDAQGANYVIIFDPKSEALDFKVNLGVDHNLFAKNADGNLLKNYVPKRFRELISDQNAVLDGNLPFAAINGDYIDVDHTPQGFNVSRGVEYSGIFYNKRSSFAISGGAPRDRTATIQIGRRTPDILNFNAVGGNGRFYRNGKFRDICGDLGVYACKQETNRSMAAITDKGYVILLVNNAEPDRPLYPDQFDDVLEGIATNHSLGNLQEGLLFDGGLSTAIYYDDRIYIENPNPMGSVLLIYKKA